MRHDRAGHRSRSNWERPDSSMPGTIKMYKVLLTTLFAVALSFLTFAASFAEVPRSAFVPLVTQH